MGLGLGRVAGAKARTSFENLIGPAEAVSLLQGCKAGIWFWGLDRPGTEALTLLQSHTRGARKQGSGVGSGWGKLWAAGFWSTGLFSGRAGFVDGLGAEVNPLCWSFFFSCFSYVIRGIGFKR